MTEDIQFSSAIGAGAYAVVYRGVYQGADVAIKLAVTDVDKMCWGEAFLASQLRHPHVVQTYVARGAVLTSSFLDEIYQLTARRPAPPADLLPQGPSEDGLGNPRKATHELQGWRDVLSRCGATPNKCLLILVQELCEQGTLSRAIRAGVFKARVGVQTEAVARRILLRTATEICRGMIHLHKASVIHGDLKPANVLLARSNVDRRGFVAKIADFGLARLLQDNASRVESSTLGTVAYMSPESFKGSHSKAGDVYAFGMLLWEMMVGKRPFEDMFVGQIMLEVGFRGLRPPWPDEDWPELCELGRKCVAQEPGERPSFKELEEALVRMEEGLRDESLRESQDRRRQSLEALRNSGAPLPSLPASPRQLWQSLSPHPQPRPPSLPHSQPQPHLLHHMQVPADFMVCPRPGSARPSSPRVGAPTPQRPGTVGGGGLGEEGLAGVARFATGNTTITINSTNTTIGAGTGRGLRAEALEQRSLQRNGDGAGATNANSSSISGGEATTIPPGGSGELAAGAQAAAGGVEEIAAWTPADETITAPPTTTTAASASTPTFGADGSEVEGESDGAVIPRAPGPEPPRPLLPLAQVDEGMMSPWTALVAPPAL